MVKTRSDHVQLQRVERIKEDDFSRGESDSREKVVRGIKERIVRNVYYSKGRPLTFPVQSDKHFITAL